MIIKTITITLLLALAACAAKPQVESVGLSDADAVTPAAAQAKTESSKKKRVCKEFQPTGSRIPQKICRTQEAWDEVERIAQQRLDDSTKPQTNNPQGE